MSRSPLRIVAGDERAHPRKMSVGSAADSGTRLELLIALRSRLARTVEEPNTHARDLAALSRQITEIAKEIELIESSHPETASVVTEASFDPSTL